MSYDLSIVIPARNEEFLSQTVDSIIKHAEAKTEIIVVLDGQWPVVPLVTHPMLKIVFLPESIGQRAATNLAVRVAQGKYIMKVDAHCDFDQGFDRKLIADIQDDWVMVPVMRNLHVFDWVCSDGHRRYQGKSGPCVQCGKPTTKDIVWIPKKNPQSRSYCFDAEPHFQYFNDYIKRPEYKEMEKAGLTETMSLQGSCFMVTRRKYRELNLCDEKFGSWGSQGIEVACKMWLSGGRVVVNHKTWYGHLFRTQGGDFGFPYEQKGSQVDHAKKYAKDLFFNNKWDKQVKPLSWLVEKFWPVSGWKDEDLAKLKQAPWPNK